MHRHVTLLLLGFACLVVNLGCSMTMPNPSREAVSLSLRTQALGVLVQAVRQETKWVKVHAAEGLLQTGHPAGVAAVFQAELASAQAPYRVGVLRVLAQAAGEDEAAKAEHVDKILAIFHDEGASDRLHALETLAKLGYADGTEQVLAAAEPDSGRFQTYARWVLANCGDQAPLAELIAGEDATLRTGAAYALRHREILTPETLAAVESAAAANPANVYLQSAWFVHCPLDRKLEARKTLVAFRNSDKKFERNELCAALGTAGGDRDVPILAKLLRGDPETDVRVYAASALLRITRRAEGG